MGKRMLGKRKKGAVLVVGLFLSIFALNASVTKSDVGAQTLPKNLIAAHDRSSSQYRSDCTSCHSNIPRAKSLDPSIPNVHVKMLPYAPGERNNDKCRWCHRKVDLVQGTSRVENSKGNLRTGVDMALCALCHSPSGPGKQFYQSELTPTDGASLYDLVCAACHGSLPNSEVRGESASEIQKKINENEGGMGPLGVLTREEIQAIANALRQ